MRLLTAIAMAITVICVGVSDADAKGRRSNSPGSGTGSKSSSTTVKGHITKQGKYVAPHRRSTPDKSFTNNYSTKGNTNPYTGRSGSRDRPPKKR